MHTDLVFLRVLCKPGLGKLILRHRLLLLLPDVMIITWLVETFALFFFNPKVRCRFKTRQAVYYNVILRCVRATTVVAEKQ